jgi:hypothetical protein
MTLQEALSYPLDKLVPANIAKTTITFLNEKEFESLAEHMKMSFSVKENGHDTITIGQTVFKKQINQENIYERERFRAIDFAKWFADFNGLTWEEKRVSKERLDTLYEKYLGTLGGGLLKK